MKRGQDFESSAFENESKFKLAKDSTEFKVDESSWIYKFAEKNNDIIDEVIDIEDELYDLNEKLNDDEMYLGDLEKNRFKKEIEKLSFERNEILDKLIEQIPAINGKTNVREIEGLEDVLEYIFDKKNAESEEAGYVEMESDEEENAYDYGSNEEAFDDYYGDCRDIMQMIKDRIEERENEELKRTDDDAKKKAESVRRKISELPNEIDRKDIFDPQSELLNILKISKNETGGMEKKKAAIANIEYLLKNEKIILKNVSEMEKYFLERLQSMKFKYPVKINIKGLAIGIEFEKEGYANEITKKCMRNGLLFSTLGSTMITLFPALNIDKKTAKGGLDILEKYI